MNKLYRLLVSAVFVLFVSFPSSCTEAKAVEHGKKMTDQSPPNGALKSYDWAEELELLYRVDLLPCYRTGCIVEHKSTHDPTGGNDDGFSGRYSYIREENGEKVLAELTGPGVINKIHSSAPTFDTLRFYFDGETTPRLTICFMDLFTGKVFPFVKPLSNNEIGGYYTYFPIPYSKSCKVTFKGPRVQFYQIQYRNLPGYDVKSYTGELTPVQEEAMNKAGALWAKANYVGVDDYAQGRSAQYKTVNKTFTLQPGQTVDLFTQQKGGRIVGFEIDGGNAFEGDYKDVVLRARWDNESVEAIHVPLADFFGYAYGRPAMRSLIMGSKNHVNYSYVPMPFDSRAEMQLTYLERKDVTQYPIQITARIYYNDTARDPETEGKFYANWRRERPESGHHYEFASLRGKGHYVGTIFQAQGLLPGLTTFYEGDDSTYVDGRSRIKGIGSEDYTNGGWYAVLDRWDRGISMPLHGCLDYSVPMSRTGAYRFFLNDKLTFEQELYTCVEHGPEGNAYPVDYASVAYYYCDTPPAERGMEPTEDLRTVFYPDRHMWLPQLMSIVPSGLVAEVDPSGRLLLKTAHQGFVRIMLEDVPEGRYKVYITYFEKPNGADFSVWQRQKQLTDWQTSVSLSERETVKDKVLVGEIDLTHQTNSLSIHLRKNGVADEFALGNIYLELQP